MTDHHNQIENLDTQNIADVLNYTRNTLHVHIYNGQYFESQGSSSNSRLEGLQPINNESVNSRVINSREIKSIDKQRIYQELIAIWDDLRLSRKRTNKRMDEALNEIKERSNSNLPVEHILLIQMGKFIDIEEMKLEQKMREYSLVDCIERYHKYCLPSEYFKAEQFKLKNISTTSYMKEIQSLQEKYLDMMKAMSKLQKEIKVLIDGIVERIR